MKRTLRWSKLSGSTRRRIETILKKGERSTRRAFVAADRRQLQQQQGGLRDG